MKTTKIIVQIVLWIVIVVLAILIFRSITDPLNFQNEFKRRQDAVITKLKNIRSAEQMYLQVNNRYTANWDSLAEFIESGKIPIIKLTADPKDTTFTVFFRDTVGYKIVKDSLFKNIPDFNAKELKYIPFSDITGTPKDTFSIKVDKINKGNVWVSTIEVTAPYKSFMKDYDLNRYGVDPEGVLKFGSITEPITDGNWE
ncbi:MAG: hypothetical protein QMD02_04650 [Bacteroidales bacterium]|nr:hypothetical protein [Bacteroidales bacterium]